MSDPSRSETTDVLDSALETAGTTDNVMELAGFQLWLSKNKETAFRFGLLAFVIAFVIVGTTLWLTDSLNLENLGYGGVWIVSFIAAGSIILPVPGPAAVCIAAAPDLGLNPLLIGLISASAEALGEMTGYIAGLSGRSLLERNKYYPKMHSMVKKRGGLILFFGAIIPNPLFDVIGIAAGSTGYPIKRFLAVVFVAKTIKSTGIAYACFWGIDWIQGIVG
ncbi:MAG TPA: DedA family protein [Dehalococcoidia bacterium]|jgi:membrane protein YqaA with SNARE-associated domain|nr:DedA family protein [Dehalococcoidia bacterium]HIK90176.1 DedA family protein [Dehalococcoidia bacterium]